MILLQFVLIAVMIALGLYVWRCARRIQKLNLTSVALNDELEQNVQKRQALMQEIATLREQLSTTELIDSLTGLPSRKIFEDHLSLAIHQSIRHQLTCCVMFLDLDGFKIVNDALGYDVGDILLKETAERLKTCVRQVDTLSRFSGGEFVFIFSQINKAETAAYIAKRLLDSIAQPFITQGQELYLTASIGIAVFPGDGEDGRGLLKNADVALSQAKQHGRNTYQFYQQEMHDLSRRELVLSSSLHNETSYQYFNILYQPRIDLETKKIVCMEAILQWQHPDFGLITFDEFSRLAEKNNNMIAIYEWMLHNACRDFLHWSQYNFHPQAISIQVSFKQLENTHFIQKISAILQEMKFDPNNLVFEVTESSFLTKIDMVEKTLHMLKRLGVQIAINNFGASHLQLQHLRRLPIDIFKIDRTLIDDIDSNQESEAIVKLIIALAKSLQSTVIAEGVQNEKQRNALRLLGCVTMQGELFSHPVLAKDFTEQLVETIHVSVG